MQQNIRLSLCETTQVREHMQCKVLATAAVWYTLKLHVHAQCTGCVLFGISRFKITHVGPAVCIFDTSLFQPHLFSLLRSLLKSGWWYETTPPNL